MIRQAVNYDLDQQHEAACPFSPFSCITWFISSGLPEGNATWPANADEDLPRASSSWIHIVIASVEDVALDASPSRMSVLVLVPQVANVTGWRPKFAQIDGSSPSFPSKCEGVVGLVR